MIKTHVVVDATVQYRTLMDAKTYETGTNVENIHSKHLHVCYVYTMQIWDSDLSNSNSVVNLNVTRDFLNE